MLAPRLFPLYHPDGRSQDNFFKTLLPGDSLGSAH